MFIQEYDILNILEDDIGTASYKVKHKVSGEINILQTFDCSNYSESDKNKLIKRISRRININHPNIIQFSSYFEEKEKNFIYVVTECCSNGSLKNILANLKNNHRIHEELICKILYQIICVLKTTDCCDVTLNTSNIFLDENYNVKLNTFNLDLKESKKDIKMFTIGAILYEMCTLTTFDKQLYENKCKELLSIYSTSLVNLLMHIINNQKELKQNANKILCHPTLILKSTQWTKDHCFFQVREELEANKAEKNENCSLKLEKLRNKELMLQVKEKKLAEKEQKLKNWEKKLIIMEKTLLEKHIQADLYLRRCRNSKSTLNKTNIQKITYDNLDSTYVEADDSIVISTSKKMDVNAIIKPQSFTRTMSERRIRFKGHSPLKEIDMNKRKGMKQNKLVKIQTVSECSSDWRTCSENDSEISSVDGKSKSKQLFKANTYENEYDIPGNHDENDCKPIGWDKETKKHAFEMLRLMNTNEKENAYNREKEIKHTYL